MRAAFQRRMHRRHDSGMVVSQDQRAMAAEIIDILVIVDVPFHRPQRPLNI